MRSTPRGIGTSDRPEVARVLANGFWLRLRRDDLFIAFRDFPWFRDASVAEIFDVRSPVAGHLRWPRLDVDLEVESIRRPHRFPLISRERPNPGARGRGAATPTKRSSAGRSVRAARAPRSSAAR